MTGYLSSRDRLLAWWQLLRIGNVFTAISNIIAGFLLVQREWQPLEPLLLLIGSSTLLYTAGMVLNDAFDADLDARERPERPIPSGRMSRATAFRAGIGLLVLGVSFACFASGKLQSRTPAAISALLALAILSYDAKLKQTELGPSVMGICRYLNVLLGASVAKDIWVEPAAWIFAAVVGSYTVGLTLFARTENKPGKTSGQSLGLLLVLSSAALCGLLPTILSAAGEAQFPAIWFGCLLALCLLAVNSYVETQRSPTPATFRQHVTRLLLGFILFDALACAAAAGWPAGAIVLTLVLPTILISRWAPMT